MILKYIKYLVKLLFGFSYKINILLLSTFLNKNIFKNTFFEDKIFSLIDNSIITNNNLAQHYKKTKEIHQLHQIFNCHIDLKSKKLTWWWSEFCSSVFSTHDTALLMFLSNMTKLSTIKIRWITLQPYQYIKKIQ